MVIDEKNSHINSFSKGMNSDTTYDQIANENYTFAKNVRISKNYLIGDTNTESSSQREGIITPVYKGLILDNRYEIGDCEILSVDSIDNIGVLVCKTSDNRLVVYKFILDKETESQKDQVTSFKLWWQSEVEQAKDIKAVSTVLYRELENVIKLYIATGVYPIITIRIDGDDSMYGINGAHSLGIDYVINNRIFPTSPVYIADKIGGQLKTSQVQYTYRFYNKHGITTQLAPLTNKIQIIDVSRDKEVGNAEDTVTSIGLSLRINTDIDSNISYKDIYDRIQVYRLQYIKQNQDAEVSLIYDDKITSNEDRQFILNDVGIEPLQILTMEEFAAISGIIVIPKVIEKNQDYMFAANVKDDTIIKGLTIDKTSISNEKITFDILLDKGLDGHSFSKPVRETDDVTIPLGNDLQNYIRSRNINPSLAKNTYDNIFVSSLVRSLRRGETYRYGIVFYDKYGRRSDVQDLGNVEVPEIDVDTNPTFYIAATGELYAKPVGVKIKVPTPKDENGNIPDYIVGCQIVRRSSRDIYQKTLLQVALARPIKQSLYTTQGFGIDDTDKIIPEKSPYYPFGFLTTNDGVIFPGYYRKQDVKEEYTSANSYENHNLFQIFSTEIDVRRDDVLSRLNSDNLSIQKLYIAYPRIEYDRKVSQPKQTDDLFLCNINNNIHNQLNYVQNLQPFAFSPGFMNDSTNQNTLNWHFGDTYTMLKNAMKINPVNYSLCIYKYTGFAGGGFSSFKVENDMQYYAEDLIAYKKNDVDVPDCGIVQKDKEKITDNLVFNYYKTTSDQNMIDGNKRIKSIKDVKIPKWYEGFSNIQYNGADISGGIKQYKTYTTTIGEFKYNNWNSFGCYDLKIYREQQPNTIEHLSAFLYGSAQDDGGWFSRRQEIYEEGNNKIYKGRSFIGPGPSCFLINVEDSGVTEGDTKRYYFDSSCRLGTHICNIVHNEQLTDVESDEQVQYFGFGNFFKLKYKSNTNNYVCVIPTASGESEKDYMTVFDGDIYITPHEIQTMYKAYDFNSHDTLQSMQVINYIPLESKINTLFDYGANYLNTESSNVLYDSGAIDGITSQERPGHQYNMIYANNDVSNDVFNVVTTDMRDTNNFPYRTYYSEPKINGEYIDNFNIFKAASFIDVDNQHGEITELLTDKNNLYYWQNTAFGKFSVNERSLINDQNGNTIMLGQAGILSRYDYINTKYGMRPYDYCAVASDTGIYWVDVNNKAVVAADSQKAINFSETVNVQNILNNSISQDIPRVDYDVQNNELVCKCLKGGEQLVFNTKYNIATSIYTRDYIDIVYIYNHMYGINTMSDSRFIQFIKQNYLTSKDAESMLYLTPLQVEFIVNNAASTTKVFDSQTIIPMKRSKYNGTELNPIEQEYLRGFSTQFETDIIDTNTNKIDGHTDREGNVIYNIPRYGEGDFGNRMRGKWMRTFFNKDYPTGMFTISHAITKLRQSYS